MKSYLHQRKRSRFVLSEPSDFDQFSRSLDIHNGVSGHVETVVLLSKLKSTPHVDVEISLDVLDLSRAESKSTYEEIKQYVLEYTGLNVSQLYIAQVKRKHVERVNDNQGEEKIKYHMLHRRTKRR